MNPGANNNEAVNHRNPPGIRHSRHRHGLSGRAPRTTAPLCWRRSSMAAGDGPHRKARFVGFTGHKDPSIHLMLATGFPFDSVQMPLNAFDAHFHSFEQGTARVEPPGNRCARDEAHLRPRRASAKRRAHRRGSPKLRDEAIIGAVDSRDQSCRGRTWTCETSMR